MIFKHNGEVITKPPFDAGFPRGYLDTLHATDEGKAKLTEWGITWEDEPVIELPVQEPQYKTQFTSLEYLDKFTEVEQLAVVTATMQSAQVKLWYDKMLGASYVDITDPRVIGGLDALVAFGLLDASRKEVILTPELIG